MIKLTLEGGKKYSILRHVFFPNPILMKKNYFTERDEVEKQIIVDRFYVSALHYLQQLQL